MTAKFVVRLLDVDNRLLAWAEVWASARPQSGRASCAFWPAAPTKFVIEAHGTAAKVSIHWADLDVARENAVIDGPTVEPGQVFDFGWVEPVWLVSGMRDVVLPPVTIRESVAIGVPTGGIGVKVY